MNKKRKYITSDAIYCMYCIYNIYVDIIFVVNFDALAQASDIQIERRQVVFLCWMQDLNPGSITSDAIYCVYCIYCLYVDIVYIFFYWIPFRCHLSFEYIKIKYKKCMEWWWNLYDRFLTQPSFIIKCAFHMSPKKHCYVKWILIIGRATFK